MKEKNKIFPDAQAKIDDPKRKRKLSKVFIFRCLAFASLLLAAVLCGTFAYLVLAYEESENFQTQYDSLSDQILLTTHNRLLRARSASDEVATIHSIQHSNSSDWPNAFMRAYDEINEHISKVANIVAMGMGPIVEPDKLESFETYVRSVYRSEPYISRLSAGVNESLELGVYRRVNGSVLRETDGVVDFSDYNLIVPILNVGNLVRGGSAIFFNLHSEPNRAAAIDACYECSLETKKPCTAMTDIIQLITVEEPRADTVLYRAIYPYDEPDKLVSFHLISVAWRDMLTGLIPDYVCGLDVVLSTDTQKITFSLCDGQAVGKCTGDCHEDEFRSMRVHETLTLTETDVKQPHEYHLEVYPTQLLYDSYHSNTPWISAMVVVLIILFTSIVFILYDFFVAKESREQQQVLEAKRRFVRFISHEIRTPLSTLVLGLKMLIEAMTALIKEPSVLGKLLQVVKDLEASSNMALVILNDLLKYDKIETGAMKLDLKEINIWHLIRRNIHLFRTSAEEKGIVMEEHLAGFDLEDIISLQGVRGDEVRLAEVINNIMSNAINFSPTGSKIIVKSKRVFESRFPADLKRRVSIYGSGKNEKIVFSVKDSGPGISPENLKRLFEEGVQFNSNDLQGGQGSGLGLWISKGIIELHGGNIWAISEGDGKGCTFFFQLPLISLNSPPSPSQSYHSAASIDNQQCPASYDRNSVVLPVLGSQTDGSETSEAKNSSIEMIRAKPFIGGTVDKAVKEMKENSHNEEEDLDKPKILIVDDVPLCRKMLNRLLRSKGYECVEAEDGNQCVKMIQDGLKVECVLMDFQMPFMNGPEATKELRKLGFTKPILGVTGNVMPEDIKIFKAAGADTVMAKPFQIEVFDQFVKK